MKVQQFRPYVSRRERGGHGAAATAQALTELDAAAWTVINDVGWPGRESARIDHVVVGPAGVFVILGSAWARPVTIVHGLLIRKGRAQTETTQDVRDAALAVGELLASVSTQPVLPVLCFRNGDVPDRIVDGVVVCSIVTVVHHLSFRPAIFTDDEVEAVARELRRAIPSRRFDGRARSGR
jgi:hypothetical protein